MHQPGFAGPKQLTILTKALEDYCVGEHIDPGTPEHARAGRLVWSFYELGLCGQQELEFALHEFG